MSPIRTVCALALVALSLALAACSHTSAATVVGSGVASADARALADFTAVEGRGAFDLRLRTGAPAARAVVEGDDNLVRLFETRVEGGVVHLGFPADGISYRYDRPLVVTLEAPRIERVAANGAIDVDAEGFHGGEFAVKLAGSCDLAARGALERASFDVAGAGRIETSELAAEEVEIDVSGAVKASVQATRRLVVDASGASTVRYTGTPVVEARTSGAASVTPR